MHETLTIGDFRVLRYLGAPIETERQFTDLVGETFSAEAQWLAIRTDQLPPAFFSLSSRLAGDWLQKAVTYGVKVAIVGTVSEALSPSEALAAFIRESNRGAHIWFVETIAELETRLA